MTTEQTPTSTPAEQPTAPAATPAPAPSDILNDGDNTAPAPEPKEKTFRELWPEEYQKDPIFKNYNSVEDLLKSHKHTKQLVGADKNDLIKKPKDANDKEAWDAYYAAIGRPTSTEEYSLPKDVKLEAEAVKPLQEFAFQAGLTNDQYQAFIKMMHDNNVENTKLAEEQHSQMIEEGKRRLKEKWGDAFDTKRSEVNSLLKTMPEKEKEFLTQIGALARPELLDWLANRVAPGTKDDTAIGGASGDIMTDGRPMSPSEAKAEWNRLQSDADFVKKLMNNDVRAQEQQRRLFGYMYPQQK